MEYNEISSMQTNLALVTELVYVLVLETRFWEFKSPRGHQTKESNAAGLVLRPALKTGFSEMGWGSTPLLSAKFADVAQKVEHRTENSGVAGSIPAISTNQ